MEPRKATNLCLMKSIHFRGGRAAPNTGSFSSFGPALPIAVGWFAPSEIIDANTMFTKLIPIGLASSPLAAAASRRFHDTGQPSSDLWAGLVPARACVAGIFLFAVGFFAVTTILYAAAGALMLLASLPLLLLGPVAGPGMLGRTLGQRVLPSEPGPNRYGPNPSEVTP